MRKGVRVEWIVPEYDFLGPIKRALNFYKRLSLNPRNFIKILSMMTHPGPAVQPESFAEAVSS